MPLARASPPSAVARSVPCAGPAVWRAVFGARGDRGSRRAGGDQRAAMRLRVLARFLALAALVQQCATKQRQECGLVVVEAGAPRTGSTQQFRLVHLALNELGLGDKVSDAGYFEWPEHAKLDARAARTHNQELERKMSNWTRDTVVLYKSHEYKPALLRLCDKAVVILTHASCVERAVRSVVAARFIEANRDAVVGHLHLAFEDLFKWKQHAALDQGLDDLLADPVRSLASVYHVLASKLGVPYKKADFSRYEAELRQEGNTQIPHHALDAETKRKLRAYVLEAKAEMVGEPRLTGVQWLCDMDKDS